MSGGGEGGARIKIDADAAPYVAAAEKAAKSTEKIGDTWSTIGQQIDLGVGRIGKLNMATVAIAGATALVSATYSTWISKLERAAALTEKIRAASGSEGRVSGDMRASLADLKGTLSLDDRASVAADYASRRPSSSTQEQIAVVRAALTADAAGLDAKRFGGLMGELQPFGKQAADLSAQLLQRTGGKAEESAALLTEIRQRSGAEDAQSSLGLILGAGSIDGGLDTLKSGWQTYLAQGRKGGFGTAFTRSPLSLVPELKQRPVIERLLANKSAGDQDAGRTAGTLDDLRLANEANPLKRAENEAKSQESDTEIANWKKKAQQAEAKRAAAAKFTEEADKSPVPVFMESGAGLYRIFSNTYDKYKEVRDGQPTAPPMGAASQADPQADPQVTALQQVARLIAEQTKALAPPKPRPVVPGGFSSQDEHR
jgi:hypothetical protein